MYAGQAALCRGYDGCQTGMSRTSTSTLIFSKLMKIGIDCIVNSFLDTPCIIDLDLVSVLIGRILSICGLFTELLVSLNMYIVISRGKKILRKSLRTLIFRIFGNV